MNEFSFFNDRARTEEKSVETEYRPAPAAEPIASPIAVSAKQPQISAETTSAFNSATEIEENFEYDLAVNDRRQRFANEILRLALIGIAAVGFVVLNFLFGASDKAPEAFTTAKKILANSDFRFYIFSSLYLFGFCAGFSLLQRYFAADANAVHLKYLRLREKAGSTAQNQNAAAFVPHSRRGFFDGFWLYLFGSETDELYQQIETERDSRDFLFKISRWLLFLSGLLFWLGVVSLILTFGVVFKQFGA